LAFETRWVSAGSNNHQSRLSVRLSGYTHGINGRAQDAPDGDRGGRVYDEEGNLVAMGIGAFRIFEKQGAPIV
jgi:hypothetical protein